MKVSQNMYGETFLKAMGHKTSGGAGSLASGREAVGRVLEAWGIPAGTYAIHDGSGLSRYSEISASLVTTVLRKMYEDERHRGWFLASLPVSGHDGTLDERMVGSELQRAVQAKTGTISNARALSGFLTAPSGERYIFSIIANNFLRPSSEVDAVAESALRRVLREARPAAPREPDPARR
jgi:D-alanyl-D-alanine carboxypeptidase/D-alanyl-D-alanine-endopeptidase (penicillin-binding protein 4)